MFQSLHDLDFPVKEGPRSVDISGRLAIQLDQLDGERLAGDLVNGGKHGAERSLAYSLTQLLQVLEKGILGCVEPREMPRLGLGIVDLGRPVAWVEMLKALQGILVALNGEGFQSLVIVVGGDSPPDQVKAVRRDGDAVVLGVEDDTVANHGARDKGYGWGGRSWGSVIGFLRILWQLGEGNRRKALRSDAQADELGSRGNFEDDVDL